MSNKTTRPQNTLIFSRGNKKLIYGQVIFNLPAGHSCPFAKNCQSFADRKTGKIRGGKNTVFRCYAASVEAVYTSARRNNWSNFDLLKGKSKLEMTAILVRDLPAGILYRIHSSGDFFNQDYFDAWLEVARVFPNRRFYAYTKAIPFWIKRLKEIPANFVLNASYGGTHDSLIEKHNLKSVRVVYSEQEAKDLNLEIDHDDSHAYEGEKNFALLIHGTQPIGSNACKAWTKIKKEREFWA